jgi:hypothetical protein
VVTLIMCALGSRSRSGRSEDLPPAAGITVAATNRRKSQAFATAHSRSTVAGDIPNASAVSSMLSPAKNRNSTTRHCLASIEDSASSASSSASRSTLVGLSGR